VGIKREGWPSSGDLCAEQFDLFSLRPRA
jgi:hypothetical protein